MEDLRPIIAKNICDLRTERKITQFKLAEALNYSDKAVSKWERGESVPDITVLKRIADYFDVTVDYLLKPTHEDFVRERTRYSRVSRRNHRIITSLAVALVWTIATVLFVQFGFLFSASAALRPWMLYVYAIPISMIILLVFNSIWGKRGWNYLFISLLTWSILLSLYLTFLTVRHFNFWPIFIVGIPGQVIICLCIGLKSPRRHPGGKENGNHATSA